MPHICQRCGRELQGSDSTCPGCGLPRHGNLKRQYPTRGQYHAAKKRDKTLMPMLAAIAVTAVISIAGMYFTALESRAYAEAAPLVEAEEAQIVAAISEDANMGVVEEADAFAQHTAEPPQTADNAFLDSLSAGLNRRWSDDMDEHSMNASELKAYYSRLVAYEAERLYGYEDSVFADERLGELAADYISALKTQEEALTYLNVDEDRYAELWGRGYGERTVALYEIATGYALDIENIDALNELVADAPMAWVQAENTRNMGKLLDSINFEQVKNVYGWKTYEAEAENTTGKNIPVFWLYIDLLDEEGNIAGSVSCSVENWENGHVATFEFITDEDFCGMDVTSDWGV